MTVTQVQFDMQWADSAANRIKAEQVLLSAPQSDLYVLPEMWSTGFAVHPDEVAESETDSLTVVWMSQMAQRLDAAVTGTIAIQAADGAYFNRCCFAMPDGQMVCYDKRHLFTYGGEHKRYAAGHERVIVSWRGVRFLLQTCYDLRFPVFSRNRGDYDVAIYMASWPESRRQVWDILLRARAIENQCYVIAVNRVGDDPVAHYSGGTQLIDAYGRIVSSCADNHETCITNTLDMGRLTVFREKFPVLDDADTFEIDS